MHNPVLRVGAIHDLSGFGRTSLTVVIPILSTMGIQVCPLPTAFLSTHTVDFTDFTFLDLTSEIPKVLNHWEHLGLGFNAVYSGFMASDEQMCMVARCIERCLLPKGIAVVDPVLGDNGILDPTMTPAMVERMRWLIGYAHVITPNFTEMAFLLNEPYRDTVQLELVKEWLMRLADMGPEIVVATSVPGPALSPHTQVVAYHKGQQRFWKAECSYIPAHYPGTGDAFASVLTGSLLQGDSLPIALDRAIEFVTLGIRATFGHNLPAREGILIERILPTLRSPSMISCSELI